MPKSNPKPEPLTVDTFNRHIMPQLVHIIETTIENKLEEQLESKLETKLEQKLNQKFEEKLAPIHMEIANLRNNVVEFKDEILGEVQAMREELQVSINRYDRVDRRMTKVENKLGIAAAD
jgi:proline dehydrogenase